MYIIDTHAHLDMKGLKDQIPEVLKRAKICNVNTIINVGYNLESSKNSIDLAKEYDNIYAACGIHPYDINTIESPEILNELENLLESDKVVALGEVGLDYHYDNHDYKKQRDYFLKQLEIAKKVDLPVVIHSRDAEDDTVNILTEVDIHNGVMHCFPGGVEFMEKCLDLGLYISFTGIVTYKNAHLVHESAKECPLDRLMIETDSPFLAPQKYRGTTNEPSYVVEVAKEIAKLKRIPYKDVVEASTNNAKKLFGI